MKSLSILTLVIFSIAVYGQTDKSEYKYKNYDSVVVQTLIDQTHDFNINSNERTDKIFITGRARIKASDAKELNQRIKRKDSYGSSQAMTPDYDLKILFYKRGRVKENVQISLWTNNLFATFPLKVQRQGECTCSGNGGYCCSKGGISMGFKEYLLDLLIRYNLPTNKEELLNFGQ